MTNTFEGRTFVNSGVISEMNITNYVSQLFPQFNDKQIQDTVAQYTGAGLGTAFDQAVAIMGECL